MTPEQRAELRKAAEEATPGPWLYDETEFLAERIHHPEGFLVARIAKMRTDGRYIAAANPATILQLLDYVENLERDAARYRWLRDEHWLVNPVAAVVWKRNDDRDECEWVNTESGDTLDAHIDAAMGESK